MYLHKKNDNELAIFVLSLHFRLVSKKYKNELERKELEGMYKALKWATGTLENEEEIVRIDEEFKAIL